MLYRMIREKITEKVEEIFEEIGIEEIIEKAVEDAIEDFDIEDIVVENIESIANECVTEILYDDGEDMVYAAVSNCIDMKEW